MLAGTVPEAPPSLPFFLRHLWRHEDDLVWRTDLKAVTGSWMARIQEIAMRLGPGDAAAMERELGRVPGPEEMDQICYMVQASKEEQISHPLIGAVTEQLAHADPVFASRELKAACSEAALAGDLVRAVDLAKEAVRLAPTDAEAHFRLGGCLWQRGDFAQALVECEISIQLAPDWDRPRVEAALVLFNQGRETEARERIEGERLALREPTPWLLFILAFLRERGGDIRGAIQAYEEQLALDPNDGEALDRLAHLYFISGDVKAGIDRCKRANHLGFPTVFRAWEEGYYKGPMPKERPAQLLPEGRIRLPDRFWFEKKNEG